MKSRNVLSTIACFVLMLVACFGGCDRNGSKKDTTTSPTTKTSSAPIKLTLGISPFQDTLLPIIADKKYKNWYQEEGIDIDIKVLGWTEVQEALAAGAVDVAINNCSAVVSTHPQYKEFVYAYAVNSFDDGFALMVRPNGPIHALSELLPKYKTRAEAVAAAAAQLKGKSVVTTSGTDMEQGVADTAARAGLDFERDIKIIDLNPEEGLAAFLAGAGDAYIGGLPQRTKAAKEGMLELLTGRDLGPVPLNGFVTTRRFATENREVLLRLIHVWFRIVNYTNGDVDGVGKIIADELNGRSGGSFTPEDFRKIWNTVEHFPATPAEIQRQILNPDGPDYWKNRWDDCNNYFFKVVKKIPEPTPSEGVFIMAEVQAAYLKKYGSK